MPFPDRPKTDDETRSELIRLCSVREYPHVFVLGCFARYVTIYAQQVRALNLVDALVKHGELGEGSRVAVIGGGIAGLTAAAAAARRGVATVQVFEKQPSLMRLQRNCHQRYIHPHIYDWPERHGEDKAGLPVMNWKAGIAADVVAKLDDQWTEYRKEYKDVLQEPITKCGDLSIDIVRDHPVLGPRGKEFDTVILAVGFGLDATRDTDEYWADTRIDKGGLENRGYSWLLSGTGDGGLTDLMRLCILDMQHGKLIEAVGRIGLHIGQELADKEKELHNTPEGASGAEYAKLYEAAVEKLPRDLAASLPPRNVGTVYLNSSRENLYLPNSSLLNRLIVAFLLKTGRFEFLKPSDRMLDPREQKGGGFKTPFEKRDAVKATFVIRRHGPDLALKQSFEKIWKKAERIRREWKEASLHGDWTKQPLWSPDDYSAEPDKATALRRIDFREKLRCVMIAPERDAEGENKVRLAIRRFETQGGERYFEGKSLDTEPLALAAGDIFGSPAAYERAVRALCDAPMAVFDITGYDSGVMLLLGIRSAVRRGVTLTVMSGKVPEAGLPFNIVALNPMPYEREDIANAFEAGFSALRRQPQEYLDLPAFDAIRRLGEDHRPLEAATQVLSLGWFHPVYIERSKDVLKDAFEHAYKDILQNRDTKQVIVTTLDSRSPQLVPQRLYAAIRRTKLCAIDWSGWRPNVFFEIGVRLAVNRIDPLNMICRNKPVKWPKDVNWPAEPQTAAALTQFFQPAEFTLPGKNENIEARIKDFQSSGFTRAQGALLSPGRTYQVVSECVPWLQERGGVAVHTMLSREATGIGGPATPEDAKSVRVLFGETQAPMARSAALEHLFAAWFYLYGRYEIEERLAKKDSTLRKDSKVQQLEQIAAEVAGRVLNTRDPEQRATADRIAAKMNQIGATLVGTVDVIEQARQMRAEAITARKAGNWKKAFQCLNQAIKSLDEARALLEQKRKADNSNPGNFETAIVRQLIHTWGAKGGVLRARKSYLLAVKAYDQGFRVEEEATGYGMRNTYNLTQRLITRVFADPLCLTRKKAVVGLQVLPALDAAVNEIQDQLRSGRNDDEYGLADLAWCTLLFGTAADWEARWFDFLDSRPEPYAIDVNAQLLERLRAVMLKQKTPKLKERCSRLQRTHELLTA